MTFLPCRDNAFVRIACQWRTKLGARSQADGIVPWAGLARVATICFGVPATENANRTRYLRSRPRCCRPAGRVRQQGRLKAWSTIAPSHLHKLRGSSYRMRWVSDSVPPLAFRHLRYFVTAAEHGSFRKAAAALGIQESTVSRRIRDLEDHLGASLFQRHNGGVMLTLAGHRLLRHPRKALRLSG